MILNHARLKIRSEFQQYNLSGTSQLEDLVPELGGRPLRSLIISSWRTGSTFLGDVLNSIPGNFYHYEPLWHIRIRQINGPPLADNAVNIVKSAFKCDYSVEAFKDYFEYKKQHSGHFYHNLRMWEYCKDDLQLCLDPKFTGRFCKLFPFHSMKLVRFRLRLVEKVLQDNELNVKVVLLIRDPRAVMQSRRHDVFCLPYPECSQPEYYCADLMSDYDAASNLIRAYPDRIKVIRYEELVYNPYEATRELMRFLHLNYVEATDEFLRQHTDTQNNDKHSTIRKSKDMAFKWKHLFDFDQVNHIQIACRGAMERWGYLPAFNSTHLTSESFNPLGNFSI